MSEATLPGSRRKTSAVTQGERAQEMQLLLWLSAHMSQPGRHTFTWELLLPGEEAHGKGRSRLEGAESHEKALPGLHETE